MKHRNPVIPPGILVVILLGACSSQTPFYGPLPVRNQHPAQLTVLHMDPRSARVLDSGTPDVRVDAGYSSLFRNGSGGGNDFSMDGELLRTRIKGRLGLGKGWETWVELPFVRSTPIATGAPRRPKEQKSCVLGCSGRG